MGLQVGDRIGSYEVVGTIGAGGMGEVYRGRDTKLKREVAIKILPAAFTHDKERLARFRREAELLASLNHPNIAIIHGFEETGDVHAIIMELVDGGTLADRLQAQGTLPPAEALVVARQVADALEAAHEKGIIHRDLKPGNIAFTTDGRVRVLDFGLAKSLGADEAHPSSSVTDSPTMTSPAMTQMGFILGTASYMSPEQAKGRPADKRSDLWAFGCVLYEMLTGKRPFEGEDVSDTLAAVLRSEPDWSALPADLAPSIQTLIRRSMEKDRRKRLGDISTAIYLMDEPAPKAAPAAPAPPPAKSGSSLAARWAAVAALMIAVSGATYLLTRPGDEARGGIRFFVDAPSGSQLNAGPSGAAISPDGRHIIFLMTGLAGQGTRVALRSLDTLEARPLPGTEDASNPFWSPDSRSIAFFARGRLKKVDLAGAPAQDLCAAAAGQGGSWSPDGTIVFAPSATSGLFKVPQAGGDPTPVTSLDTAKQERSHRWPWFLPDGKHFLFTAQSPSRVLVGSTTPGSPVELVGPTAAAVTTALSRAVYSSGHLLYVRDGTLIAQPFDPERLQLQGEAIPIAQDLVSNPATASNALGASTTGVLIFRTGVSSEMSELVWFDRAGRRVGSVGERTDQLNAELSHDGRKVAVSVLDPARNTRDIAIYDGTRGNIRTRFTFDPADDVQAIWSPDDARIIFSSNRRPDQQLDLFEKAANGAGADELVFDDAANNIYPSHWFAGRTILFMNGNANSPTGNDVSLATLEAGKPPVIRPVAQGAFNETAGRASPNGRWLAYQSNESGSGTETFVTRLPEADAPPAAIAPSATGGKWQVSREGGLTPVWRADGKELFFMSRDNQIMAVDVMGDGDSFEMGPVRTLFKTTPRTVGWLGYGVGRNFDVSPDGQRFLVNTVTTAAPPQPITVVVDWLSDVKR